MSQRELAAIKGLSLDYEQQLRNNLLDNDLYNIRGMSYAEKAEARQDQTNERLRLEGKISAMQELMGLLRLDKKGVAA